MCAVIQTYVTGRTNVALDNAAVCSWILNACIYAVLLCLIFYIVLEPTFRTEGLYVAGTFVFVALCNSLQLKIGFCHHQWPWPNVLVMFISVVGMYIYLLLVGINSSEYYYASQHTFSLSSFWLFGSFLGPLVVIYVDVLEYYLTLFFMPTNEQMFRLIEHCVRHYHTHRQVFSLSYLIFECSLHTQEKLEALDMLTCTRKREGEFYLHAIVLLLILFTDQSPTPSRYSSNASDQQSGRRGWRIAIGGDL